MVIFTRQPSAVQTIVACAIAVVACASPTDEDIREDAPESAEEPCVSDAAEGSDRDTASPSSRVEALDHDGTDAKAGLAVSRCNYGNVYHCFSAHQGWHWVPIEHSYRTGPVAGIEGTPAASGRMCCVRVGPRQPPRPIPP